MGNVYPQKLTENEVTTNVNDSILHVYLQISYQKKNGVLFLFHIFSSFFVLMYEDFCKRISSKSKNRMESSSSSEDEMVQEKSEEDEFIHHPFKVKDNSSIILNIRVCGHAIQQLILEDDRFCLFFMSKPNINMNCVQL